MGKRVLWLSIGLLALAGALTFWLTADEAPVSEDAHADGAEAPARDAHADPLAPVSRGGRVSGTVVRDGKPVARARVTLRSTAPLVAISMDDGAFLFDDVPSGQAYLSASTADAASDVLGPYQLLPSTRIEGVELVLRDAVKIEGRVIDLVTRKPVAGATLISAQNVGRTDADGRFSLAGPPSQTWLEVTAPGFLSRAEWVSLELARTGGTIEVVLTPASHITGTVTESGAPIGAATVWAEAPEGAGRGARTANVFTDKDGHFDLECAAGTLALSAVTPRGTKIRGPTVRLAVGERRENVNLDALDVSSADGVVTREGAPVAGAQVSAIDPVSEDVAGFASTGPDGRFRFDSLILGNYLVQVRAGALTSIAGPFRHRGDGTGWNVELHQGAVLQGRVEPASAGVSVRWRSGSWSGPSASTVTDAEGRFRFEGLPAEMVSLDAEGPDGAATVRARAGDEVVLALQKGSVLVHLQDESGAPITDGVVSARNLLTGVSRREAVLAPAGVTRMTLAPGRWELMLEVTGKGRSAPQAVDVKPEGATVTLSIETTIVVAGHVTAVGSNLPMANVRVEAFSGDFGRWHRVSVLTDARGDFLLPPVSRKAGLRASADGYQPAWRGAAEGPRWDFAMTPNKPDQQPQKELEQFEGVGMTLDGRTGNVLVTLVSEGSPAERAGVLAGDQILLVDGVPVAGQPLNDVVARIRGPAGTPVTIEFQRNGQPLTLTMRRRMLTL